MEEDKNRSFLGKGWSFPPEFGGGVNPIRMAESEEDIRQSLIILFSTRPGERVMRPEYGVNLHELVFRNMDLTARTQLTAAIEKAILFWEPRISLNSVSFDLSEEVNGVLYILLDYTIRRTNTRSNMVYPYYHEEHF